MTDNFKITMALVSWVLSIGFGLQGHYVFCGISMTSMIVFASLLNIFPNHE